MSKKCKRISMVNKCRICLGDNKSMIDIFTPEIFIKIKEFAASVSIVIDGDNDLPKNICHICLYKLEMWDEFKQQLINSNKLLLNLLNNHELSDFEKNPVNVADSTDFTNSNNFMQLDHIPPQINFQSSKELRSEVINNIINDDGAQSLFSLKMIKNGAENSSENNQTSPPIIKTRHFGVRRTNEQRMASTQRWVARKRALLAATGENDSDTDSINSDATLKLSSLKRPRKSFHLTTNENHQLEPQSVQSELVIGDALFIVTSTLFLSELPSIDRLSNVLNLPSNHKSNIVVHEQQNIDIMNALQLCRINTTNKCLMDDGKFVERCLNIEIEGTKLETLQNLQSELASFIEKDIKKKLINEYDYPENISRENIKLNEPFQTLEQQLKVIVEKAIKKNVYRSQNKQDSTINKINNKCYHNKTFSNAFIKAAMKSQIFQPRVILDRLDLDSIEIENVKDSYESPKRSLTNLNYYEDQSCDTNKSNDHFYETDINILKKLQKNDRLINVNNSSLNEKRHVCETCGMSFNSQLQAEKHFSIHKKERTLLENFEKKMMRCKKCHQIVETDFVKTHICESFLFKNRYKCNKCDVIFFAESLLLNHKRIHQNDKKNFKVSAVEFQNSYSCFICDKKFTDDEILKEHLQKHCDDTSEEENNSTNKSIKLYQCAICGHTLDTEDELENHVEQHLFNDADDNPNLVNVIQADNIKKSPEIQFDVNYSYLQGEKKIDSNVKLAFDTSEHDSKVADCDRDDFQMQNECRLCSICDLTFNNEQELLKHLNIHNNASCVCMLCDQPFLTLVELEDHVNSH